LNRAADDDNWVKTCSDLNDCQTSAGDFADHVQRDILDTLELCQDDLRDNPDLDACTAPLQRFAPAWLRQHGSQSYGFEQPNAQYLAAQLAPDAPAGMMDPPSELLRALPSRAEVQRTAERAGWAYLTHDSCLGGVRLFVNVVDPDDRFDQWLLLGVAPDEDAFAAGAILSFLAVQKQNADGSRLTTPRVHFRDYVLNDADGVWQAQLPELNDGKCYACHGSGVRQLLPSPSASTSSAERLSDFNQRLESYGLPDWNGTIEAANYGPPLGAELGCTHCHDGKVRGPLTVFTSEGMLYQKVVAQLSMRAFDGTGPVPDEPAMRLLERQRSGALTTEQARALAQAQAEHEADYAALVASRLPSLQAWLLHTACD
jgi:hypothetical protein